MAVSEFANSSIGLESHCPRVQYRVNLQRSDNARDRAAPAEWLYSAVGKRSRHSVQLASSALIDGAHPAGPQRAPGRLVPKHSGRRQHYEIASLNVLQNLTPVWIPGGRGTSRPPGFRKRRAAARTSCERQRDLVTCGSFLQVRIQPATICRPIRRIGGDDIKPARRDGRRNHLKILRVETPDVCLARCVILSSRRNCVTLLRARVASSASSSTPTP